VRSARRDRRAVIQDDVLGDSAEEAPGGVQFRAHISTVCVNVGQTCIYRRADSVTISTHSRRCFPCASVSVPVSPKSICASCRAGGSAGPHRRYLLPTAEFATRKSTQRRVPDGDAFSRQQLVHANESQRRPSLKPRLDLRAARTERAPRIWRRWQRRICTRRPTAPTIWSDTAVSSVTPPSAAWSKPRPIVLRSRPVSRAISLRALTRLTVA